MPAVTMKKSRQREAILDFLSKRKDHPKADTVYDNVRKEFPNISMGTIQKLAMGSGAPDRFDFNSAPHYHFLCRECRKVMDLEIDNLDSVDRFAAEHFNGTIEGHVAYFFGLCPECKEAENRQNNKPRRKQK